MELRDKKQAFIESVFFFKKNSINNKISSHFCGYVHIKEMEVAFDGENIY